jgi:hypothetical protein
VIADDADQKVGVVFPVVDGQRIFVVVVVLKKIVGQ